MDAIIMHQDFLVACEFYLHKGYLAERYSRLQVNEVHLHSATT